MQHTAVSLLKSFSVLATMGNLTSRVTQECAESGKVSRATANGGQEARQCDHAKVSQVLASMQPVRIRQNIQDCQASLDQCAASSSNASR